MKTFGKFYSSIAGRVIIDFFLGFVVGYLIYLWRDNERAPFLCAVATGAIGYFKAKGVWPWNKKVRQ